MVQETSQDEFVVPEYSAPVVQETSEHQFGSAPAYSAPTAQETLGHRYVGAPYKA
jgi:hypothetical protein